MSRTLNGRLTGKAAQGYDDIYSSSNAPTDVRDVIHERVSCQLQADLAQYWASQVAPVDVDKFNLAMQFISLQESVHNTDGCGNDSDLYDYARGG